MEKLGKVISISGDHAVVSVHYQCSGDCETCHVGHLFAPDSKTPREIQSLNKISAEPGDAVRIELDTGKSLMAYGLAYGIPMLGLLIGVLLGAWIASMLEVEDTLPAGIGGLAGVGGGFLVGLSWGRKFRAVPEITKILNKKQDASRDE